jgi:hypothetical protein
VDKSNLDDAIFEAERFIKAAKKVTYTKRTSPHDAFTWLEISHPEAAATKRASLDLTKALARLRKP